MAAAGTTAVAKSD